MKKLHGISKAINAVVIAGRKSNKSDIEIYKEAIKIRVEDCE